MEIWKDIKGYEGLYQVSNLRKSKEFKVWERENTETSIRLQRVLYHISTC